MFDMLFVSDINRAEADILAQRNARVWGGALDLAIDDAGGSRRLFMLGRLVELAAI